MVRDVASVPAHGDPLHVVIAGGGVAALEAVLALRALAGDRVRITLIAPDLHFAYRPLAVAEPFDLGSVRRVPLDHFCAAHGVRRCRSVVGRVDADRHVVWSADGTPRPYDVLLLASGARPGEAVAGALTYRGEQDGERLRDVLAAAAQGRVERLAFVVPPGATWTLPMYELALMATRWLTARASITESMLITSEHEPLELFGPEASAAVRRLLRRLGIALRVGCDVEAVDDGRMWMRDGGSARADRAVSLPRLTGRAPEGVPHDALGFVDVDELCRVRGVDDVLAIGDLTAGPVKQGGLATQQADAAATLIAHRSGAPVDVMPYRPVLRGLLLTGEQPTYLRRPPGHEAELTLAHEPLWWPPHKIAGRHLGPYLAGDLDLAAPPSAGHVAVERPVPALASRA